jgi:Lrp/AsnC family transcriptional regulator of ectoine degradation
VIKADKIEFKVALAKHTAQDMRLFEERVRAAPKLRYETGGGVEYMRHVVLRDIDRYQRFIDLLLTDDIGIEKHA